MQVAGCLRLLSGMVGIWKMRVKKMVIAEAMGVQHSVAHILQEQGQDCRRVLTSDGDSDSGSEKNTSVFVRSLRTALLICSAIYGTANRVLDAAYACGIMNPTRLPVPVISVGNATWGGNGKTPMAIFLARLAHAQGLRPLVLTRGYGGDEDKLLCRRLAGVAGVGSGPNRAAIAAHMLSISSSTNCPKLPTRSRCMHLGDYKCGEVEGHGRHTSAEGVDGARDECSAQARRRYRYDLVILDDGHQHRKLVRDYNILMINCLDTSIVHWTSRDDADGGAQTRAELRGQLLPLGTLREPLEQGIAKAHLIVLHNCDLLSEAQLSALSYTVTNQWTNSLDRRSASRAEKQQTVQMSDTAATPPQQPPPLILTYSQVSSIRPLLPFCEHAGGGEGLGAVGSVDWWLSGVSAGSRSMSPNTQKPRSAHCASHTRRAATHAPQSAAAPADSAAAPADSRVGPDDIDISVAGKDVVAVAALANPVAFFLKVQALGVRRLFPNPFPDHHAFTNRDLRHLVYDYIASHHSGNLRTHTGGLGLSTPLSITVITTDKDECRSAESFRSLTSLTYLTRHPRHQLHITLHTSAAAQSSNYPEIKVEVLVMETDLRIFGNDAAAEHLLKRVIEDEVQKARSVAAGTFTCK